MMQSWNQTAASAYSYYSFTKVSFAGLIRIAHQSEGVLCF